MTTDPPPRPTWWSVDRLIGVAGLAVAIVAIVAPLVLQARQQRLALSATIDSSTQIVGSNLPSPVRVTVRGNEAHDVYVSVLKIANTGGRPISPDLFAGGAPLQLRLGDRCEIVEARLTRARPSDVQFRVYLQSVGSILRVAPLLLNPQDAFYLQVLTTGCHPRLEPSASIVGISEISQQDADRTRSVWALRGLEILSVLFGLTLATLTFLYEARLKQMTLLQRRFILIGIFLLFVPVFFFLANAALSNLTFIPTVP